MTFAAPTDLFIRVLNGSDARQHVLGRVIGRVENGG
jgi:hypothetical protein